MVTEYLEKTEVYETRTVRATRLGGSWRVVVGCGHQGTGPTLNLAFEAALRGEREFDAEHLARIKYEVAEKQPETAGKSGQQ